MTLPFRRGAGGPKRVHTIVNAARMSACATSYISRGDVDEAEKQIGKKPLKRESEKK
jgi:hypothetical protein